MIKAINHLGIATKSIEEMTNIFREVLPSSPVHLEEIADQKVKVSSFIAGSSHIEFLEPTSPESPISKFLEKNGTGVHHVAFTTDNLIEELKSFKEKGFRLIDETPRTGMGGVKIAFLHPKSTGGILIELCQE